MKLEDVTVGQILKDKFGNKYKVTSVEDNDLQSVLVTCIEFKQDVYVSDLCVSKCGDCLWLLNHRNLLLPLESPSGRKIAKNLKFANSLNRFQKNHNITWFLF